MPKDLKPSISELQAKDAEIQRLMALLTTQGAKGQQTLEAKIDAFIARPDYSNRIQQIAAHKSLILADDETAWISRGKFAPSKSDAHLAVIFGGRLLNTVSKTSLTSHPDSALYTGKSETGEKNWANAPKDVKEFAHQIGDALLNRPQFDSSYKNPETDAFKKALANFQRLGLI
jgi:hypothetical protein